MHQRWVKRRSKEVKKRRKRSRNWGKEKILSQRMEKRRFLNASLTALLLLLQNGLWIRAALLAQHLFFCSFAVTLKRA